MKCCIQTCRNHRRKHVKGELFSVPIKKSLRKAWLKAINIDPQEITLLSWVCSLHFNKEDFINANASKLQLKPLAVPSINLSVKIKEETEAIQPITEPDTMSKKDTTKRTYGRRAASKEALKQMHLILDDEAETLEIPDDDEEVVPVDFPAPPPPKKKYKISHRKSSDGDREVLVFRSITNHNVENTLDLECWPEELSPEQLARNNRINSEEKEMMKQIKTLMDKYNAEAVYKGIYVTSLEVADQIKTIKPPSTAAPIVLNNTQGIQLVMGSGGLGLMGIMAPVASTSQPPQVAVGHSPAPKVTKVTSNVGRPTSTRGRGRKPNSLGRPPAMQHYEKTPPPVPTGRVTTRGLTPGLTATPFQSSPFKPAESNVEGGLTTGTKAAEKKMVEFHNTGISDSREISFSKLQGKTYPSLVVVAKPQMRATNVGADRPKLDTKVKSVLMTAPTKFTEWLIQQGLVKSEQKCSVHNSTLKLGMYSDVSKFPYSGGYVWISDCCPHKFVSVFNGSLFEGSPHPPIVILKLLYHWSCQTNIQNVTQWVKVNNLYVKGMFTYLRSVCTVALHTHLRRLGGPGIKVEIGVISLGTTSQDGAQRQVKVEVLGVLESNSKLMRLRAVEPLADGDKNYRKRFLKILEPVLNWVHPTSTIVTDMTVDKITLNNMGFHNIIQNTSNDNSVNNKAIMEYLRRIVPRMFQNTLSLLSRQIIQQFLDELVWREWFGTTTCCTFDNLILHLAEQTRAEQNLMNKLCRVAISPFSNWAPVKPAGKGPPVPPLVLSHTLKSISEKPTGKGKGRKSETQPDPRPPKSNSPDIPEQLVPLENYYYGTIDHYVRSPKINLNIKCPQCKEVFNNNLQLMNHLFRHAHNVSMDAQLCRYCLTSVPTANDILKHFVNAHPCETKFDNGFVCLICETHYMNPFVLGKHMSKEHFPSELPYQCGSCSYRCSNHKQIIDHFYKAHDNGPTIQCPFCLKSTTIYSSSRNLAQNITFFIQHLQKHQKKQFAKRCGKCNLWFINKEDVKEHQAKMHCSQRGKHGLICWAAPRNGVMVPKSKMEKYPGDADVINFGTLSLNVSKTARCKECNNHMNSPKHFPSFETCQNPNCQYSTCCTMAMQVHNAKCSKKTEVVPAPEPLLYEMFCVCGFSSWDGNILAKHLAICERKSAYPSMKCAKQACVTHSMLDVLGLVRNPETAVRRKKIKRSTPSISIEESDIKEEKDDSIETTSVQLQDSEKVVKTDEIVKTLEMDDVTSISKTPVEKITKKSEKTKDDSIEKTNVDRTEVSKEKESSNNDKTEEKTSKVEEKTSEVEDKSPEVEASEEKSSEIDASEEKSSEIDASEEKSSEVDASEEKSSEVDASEEKSPELEASEEKASEVSEEKSESEDATNEPEASEEKTSEVSEEKSETEDVTNVAEAAEIDASEEKSSEAEISEEKSYESEDTTNVSEAIEEPSKIDDATEAIEEKSFEIEEASEAIEENSSKVKEQSPEVEEKSSENTEKSPEIEAIDESENITESVKESENISEAIAETSPEIATETIDEKVSENISIAPVEAMEVDESESSGTTLMETD